MRKECFMCMGEGKVGPYAIKIGDEWDETYYTCQECGGSGKEPKE